MDISFISSKSSYMYVCGGWIYICIVGFSFVSQPQTLCILVVLFHCNEKWRRRRECCLVYLGLITVVNADFWLEMQLNINKHLMFLSLGFCEFDVIGTHAFNVTPIHLCLFGLKCLHRISKLYIFNYPNWDLTEFIINMQIKHTFILTSKECELMGNWVQYLYFTWVN